MQQFFHPNNNNVSLDQQKYLDYNHVLIQLHDYILTPKNIGIILNIKGENNDLEELENKNAEQNVKFFIEMNSL